MHICVLIVGLLCIGAASAATLRRSLSTCNSYSLNSFRSFATDGFFESSCRTGSALIFKNRWLQVVSHTQLNTNTNEFDLKSNKLYLEFYGETGLPIAYLSSDSFINCEAGRQTSSSSQMTEFGLNGALRINFQHDTDELHAAYIDYPAAKTRVYVRRAHHGFNFGIQTADVSDAVGLCVSGARSFDKKQFEWLISSNLALARQTCDTVFASFRLIDNQFKSELLRACVEDVAASQHAHMALDYRNGFVDQLFFTYNDFSQFIKDIKSILESSPVSKSTLSNIFPEQNIYTSITFMQQKGCVNVEKEQPLLLFATAKTLFGTRRLI